MEDDHHQAARGLRWARCRVIRRSEAAKWDSDVRADGDSSRHAGAVRNKNWSAGLAPHKSKLEM